MYDTMYKGVKRKEEQYHAGSNDTKYGKEKDASKERCKRERLYAKEAKA
jgi:hypothetical protein